MPFYKWAFKGLGALEKLQGAAADLKELVLLKDGAEHRGRKQGLIEDICVRAGRELNARGFSHRTDPFLQEHCKGIMEGIEDSQLRNLHVMADCD